MSVSEKIRSIREAKGLTQEQVAEKAGISSSIYGDIERGDNDPKLSKLQKIAEAFEIEVSELVDLSEKGTVNVSFARQQKTNNHQNNVYVGSCAAELKEQKFVNELQQKEINMLKEKVDDLKVQIVQLQKINALLEKNQ